MVIEAINPAKSTQMSIHGAIPIRGFSSFLDSKAFKASPKYFDRRQLPVSSSDQRRKRKPTCQEEIDLV
jgi:hypothetical protein